MKNLLIMVCFFYMAISCLALERMVEQSGLKEINGKYYYQKTIYDDEHNDTGKKKTEDKPFSGYATSKITQENENGEWKARVYYENGKPISRDVYFETGYIANEEDREAEIEKNEKNNTEKQEMSEEQKIMIEKLKSLARISDEKNGEVILPKETNKTIEKIVENKDILLIKKDDTIIVIETGEKYTGDILYRDDIEGGNPVKVRYINGVAEDCEIYYDGDGYMVAKVSKDEIYYDKNEKLRNGFYVDENIFLCNREAYYKDGKLDGECIEYSLIAGEKNRTIYKNGIALHTAFFEYEYEYRIDEDGSNIGEAKDRNGIYTEKKEDDTVVKANYKNGLLEGESLTYNLEGKLIEKKSYKKGLLDGKYIKYNSDGKIIEKAVYKDGDRK